MWFQQSIIDIHQEAQISLLGSSHTIETSTKEDHSPRQVIGTRMPCHETQVIFLHALLNSKERMSSAWVPAVLSWLMILAFLLPLFRCTQKQTQAVNYPHHGKDGKKTDYQWMASAILTMILGRENLADLVGRLWATCGGQYVDESQPNHPGAAGAAENRQRAPDGPPRKIAIGRISNRKQVFTPVLRWPLRSTQNWEHHLLV